MKNIKAPFVNNGRTVALQCSEMSSSLHQGRRIRHSLFEPFDQRRRRSDLIGKIWHPSFVKIDDQRTEKNNSDTAKKHGSGVASEWLREKAKEEDFFFRGGRLKSQRNPPPLFLSLMLN